MHESNDEWLSVFFGRSRATGLPVNGMVTQVFSEILAQFLPLFTAVAFSLNRLMHEAVSQQKQ
jgi:hypothetical protein